MPVLPLLRHIKGQKKPSSTGRAAHKGCSQVRLTAHMGGGGGDKHFWPEYSPLVYKDAVLVFLLMK